MTPQPLSAVGRQMQALLEEALAHPPGSAERQAKLDEFKALLIANSRGGRREARDVKRAASGERDHE